MRFSVSGAILANSRKYQYRAAERVRLTVSRSGIGARISFLMLPKFDAVLWVWAIVFCTVNLLRIVSPCSLVAVAIASTGKCV